MLCLKFALPFVTKRLESITISRSARSVVVCAARGPRPRYPRVWKSKRRIGTISKAATLVDCIKGLSNVKEEVYGALDSFIAWDLEFPLITVKKALKTLENEMEWKRIIQVTKWMLSKGQGRTMGTYFTLLNALAEDGRLDEAEELWAKIFSDNLESTPRIFFNKMISIYYRRGMHEKMFEVFADMEELEIQPNVSIVSMMGDVFKKLGMLDKYKKLMRKYPPPKWEYRYIKGKRVRIRAKPKKELDAITGGQTEDEEINKNWNDSSEKAEVNASESFGETEANADGLFKEAEADTDELYKEAEANTDELYKEAEANTDELFKGAEANTDDLFEEAEANTNEINISSESAVSC